MKKIITVLLCIGLYGIGFAQFCNIERGLKEIESLNQIGKFNEIGKKIDQLIDCDSISDAQLISLGIWKYKKYRNTLKNKKAKASLLEVQAFITKKNIPQNLDFQLLLAENYALNKETDKFQQIIKAIEPSIFRNSNEKSFAIGRYYLLQYYNLKKGGQESKAISYLQKALKAFKSLNQVPIYYLGNTLRGLGNMNRNLGDYDKSISYYTEELEFYSANYNPDHFNIAVTNYNLGSIYYEKLAYKMALKHYLKTHKVWIQVYRPNNVYMRNLNEAIGDLYWELGDYENAITFFNYSFDIEKKINNDRSEQFIELGDSLTKNGSYNFALEYYQDALSWRENTYGKNHILTGACTNFVARAIRSSGNIEASLDAYQEAINIFVEEMTDPSWYLNPTLDMKIHSHQYLLESLIAKGGLFVDLFNKSKKVKDIETALATYEAALFILEDMKNREMSESSRVFWSNRTITLIENSIEVALQLYNLSQNKTYLEKAFNFSERSKALLLLNSLYDQDIQSFANVSKEIIVEEKKLKSEINEYLGRIKNEEKRCAEVRTKILKLWQTKLQTLQNDYDLLIDEIKENYPKYYNLKYDQQIANLATIQAHIKNDARALVAYFTGDEKTYVFFITKEDISVRSIKNTTLLFQQTNTLFNFITDLNSIKERPQQSYEEYINLAYQLYKKLLQPELADGKTKNLIIIPDGILSYLPFESLLTQEMDTKKRNYGSLNFLIKKYAVSYSPSASILMLSKNINKTNNNYLGFAPNYEGLKYSEKRETLTNLKYNKEEVDFATQLFDGKSWIGNDATEEVLKNNSSQSSILHLAMHGEVEDEHPLLSKLYFNPSEKEDGILYTYEIYNLTLSAQLVILSACNTARGKLVRGEGILSLERAFQYAGSKALLSTFWKVDDESSATLNKLFLKNLKAGNDKDRALQKAKLQFLNSATPNKLHPFYWSSFKLTGNIEPINKTSNKKYYLLGIGILFLIVLVYFRRNRQKKIA